MVDASKIVRWIKGHSNPNSQLCLDSRKVKKGDVFFAVKGIHSDAREFLGQVAEQGASCAVVEAGFKGEISIPILEVKDLYAHMGAIASEFYSNPSHDMLGIAVTGTNGKTTTVNWLRQLLSENSIPCASIGTLGCTFVNTQLFGGSLTTPDPILLQSTLEKIRELGGKAFAMEASSIGLEQGRLNGVELSIGVFTNLSRDHLDYHKTMEIYWRAKAKLFEMPALRSAVINIDSPAGERMAKLAASRGLNVITTALANPKANLVVSKITHGSESIGFEAILDGKHCQVEAEFLGTFNVENCLGVIAVATLAGIDFEKTCRLVQTLQPPKGRLQKVSAPRCPLVIVDYAHTPDAVEQTINALEDLKKFRGGKLWCVLGAGGDRDPGKRPLMGKAACKAEKVVITSDNPRTEDPVKIIDQVVSEIDKNSVDVIVDRAEAIGYAIGNAKACDVVLIAGKGHEDYQEINGVRHHFSDVEQARAAQQKRKEV